MSDSKHRTNLQKGARVINAAVRELEIPDDLKTMVQHVVTLFATDLLPGLWFHNEARPRRAPEPDKAGAPKPAPRGPGQVDEREATADEQALASLHQQIRNLVDDDDDDDPRPHSASAAPTEAQSGTSVTRTWQEHEFTMLEAALETLRVAQTNQFEQFNQALGAAMKRGVEPTDIVDVLQRASDYCNNNPAAPTLLALTPRGAKRDLH